MHGCCPGVRRAFCKVYTGAALMHDIMHTPTGAAFMHDLDNGLRKFFAAAMHECCTGVSLTRASNPRALLAPVYTHTGAAFMHAGRLLPCMNAAPV